MANNNKLSAVLSGVDPTPYERSGKFAPKNSAPGTGDPNDIIYGSSKLNASGYSDYADYLRDLSIENSSREFKFNEVEAQKARNWQERMSNTSHQREVEDLKAAGLNPVLSANSGASAYSASSASASGDDPTGAMSSYYTTMMATKMNNDNAVKIAKMNNQTNLAMSRLSSSANLAGALAAASASRYASDNAYLASIYGTDRSKYGLIDSALGGFFDGTGNTNASKYARNPVKAVVKGKDILFSGIGSALNKLKKAK